MRSLNKEGLFFSVIGRDTEEASPSACGWPGLWYDWLNVFSGIGTRLSFLGSISVCWNWRNENSFLSVIFPHNSIFLNSTIYKIMMVLLILHIIWKISDKDDSAHVLFITDILSQSQLTYVFTCLSKSHVIWCICTSVLK